MLIVLMFMTRSAPQNKNLRVALLPSLEGIAGRGAGSVEPTTGNIKHDAPSDQGVSRGAAEPHWLEANRERQRLAKAGLGATVVETAKNGQFFRLYAMRIRCQDKVTVMALREKVQESNRGA